MNADLHMAGELKNTGKGNLFVIFGEPDIDILPVGGDSAESNQVRVKINGVDVFHPNTGEVRSDGADGIACWFIDTDYNEESFFVRHAYFLGANDPYKALKTTLKAEIDPDAWASLHSDVSRPFDRPESGRIAVKVICTAPGFLDTRLRYAAWRSSYCWRASSGVRYASFSRRQHWL